jgi:ferredoxin
MSNSLIIKFKLSIDMLNEQDVFKIVNSSHKIVNTALVSARVPTIYNCQVYSCKNTTVQIHNSRQNQARLRSALSGPLFW